MKKNVEVVIVGAGSMGMAAGYYLSKLGMKVLLIDAHNPPHDKGSHHGETRIIRHAYGEGSQYVPLVLRAQQLWDQLEQESDMKLFLHTGVLCAGDPKSSFVKGAVDSGRKYTLPIEHLSKEEIEYRWRGFSLPEGFSGCYEPNSGVLFSEQCIAAFRKLGLENGMTYLPFTKVEKIEMNANGAVIQTDLETYFADFTIVSAGAWSGKILKQTGLDLPLRPVRKTVSWVECSQELYDSQVFPAYTFDLLDAHYYGFPSINGSGVKVGRHDGGQPIDPDVQISPYGQSDEEEIRSFLHKCLPNANGPLRKGSTCKYTLTPDEDFILDRHPEHQHLFIAAGFSGHGFKFSSVVGEIISQVITEGKTPFDLSSFKINR
ncbi:N-methyl-L-tryptophan oxidase [Bacillus sp. BRMEA1]|uniref:N-methyl-L-tryptophan oxidase n=1 Tax=Neobacillus endophyticus TaxID=2738405 RepID=UPI001565111A|nr:N-methyl-L-tryptophan oxidase [Neobacillus endophyticus]NRD79791.1 N-methyl-L-tryptophan oxidase [Neobacillus endophyticus]